MSTSTLVNREYPRRPTRETPECVYSNFDHVLDWGVANFLMLNQDHFAQHSAKCFCGYVYACVGNDNVLKWYEEVWVGHELQIIYRGTDLQAIINRVTEDYGYA